MVIPMVFLRNWMSPVKIPTWSLSSRGLPLERCFAGTNDINICWFTLILLLFWCSWNQKHQLLSDEIYAVILKDETVLREIPLHFCSCLEIHEYFSAWQPWSCRRIICYRNSYFRGLFWISMPLWFCKWWCKKITYLPATFVCILNRYCYLYLKKRERKLKQN